MLASGCRARLGSSCSTSAWAASAIECASAPTHTAAESPDGSGWTDATAGEEGVAAAPDAATAAGRRLASGATPHSFGTPRLESAATQRMVSSVDAPASVHRAAR
eukprot:3608179-Prymnesium_polylepis.1